MVCAASAAAQYGGFYGGQYGGFPRPGGRYQPGYGYRQRNQRFAAYGGFRSIASRVTIRALNKSSRRFHNHGEGHYKGLLWVKSVFIFKTPL